MPTDSYYQILGIRITASSKEIELAYKGRRTQYHPDKYATSDEETTRWATRIMQEVNEAYAVLSDVNLRKAYDLNCIHDAPKAEEPAAQKARSPDQPARQVHAKRSAEPQQKSWKKAFIITPVVTWIVSYAGYGILGFTPAAFVLSGVPTGLVSAMLYYYLLPKSKFVVSVITFATLYFFYQYFPSIELDVEMQRAAPVRDNAYIVAAAFGIVLSFFIQRRTRP